jgi:nucleoside-diphosphate-sugar epimerase
MASGVAIIGAGGFVGARFLEMATLAGRTDVVPVVRAYRSVGRNAHLGVPHRLADASRLDSLREALTGCDVVVNVTTGYVGDILPITQTVYAAAVAVGARMLVHMSSAAVYGGVERPDLPDDAPPRLDHWMPYARQKGMAENFLRERMRDGKIAIVVLRPSLVWGPGSPWVLGPAGELVRGSAYLIGGGAGICNLMYVDNLVRSISAVVAHPAPATGFFNIGDDERTTWRKYYAALAAGLGLDVATIHSISGERYRTGLRDRLDGLRSGRAYRWLKDRLSLETRTTLKFRLARARGREGEWSRPALPSVTRTMWDVQSTRHQLPTQRFPAMYGNQNLTSFSSGIAASLAWLRFIGLDERDQPTIGALYSVVPVVGGS